MVASPPDGSPPPRVSVLLSRTLRQSRSCHRLNGLRRALVAEQLPSFRRYRLGRLFVVRHGDYHPLSGSGETHLACVGEQMAHAGEGAEEPAWSEPEIALADPTVVVSRRSN